MEIHTIYPAFWQDTKRILKKKFEILPFYAKMQAIHKLE